MSNKSRGFSYERRRLAQIKREGGFGLRAFASKGIIDIMYIDKKGIAHLEQLKFSSRGKPRCSREERERLRTFAQRFDNTPAIIALVLKPAHKEPEVIRLNETTN